ncbi:MAG: tetratricopeptide repeat protein [Bacteroidales bacterium]
MNDKTAIEEAQEAYERGLVLRQEGNFAEARNYFRKALDLRSNFEEAKVALEMIDKIFAFGNTQQHNV